MSGYYGPPVILPKCTHGVVLAYCNACEADAEAERIAERRRVHDPAQRILDAIAARRRWFDACAFCTPNDDALYAELRHMPDCPWQRATQSNCEEKSR